MVDDVTRIWPSCTGPLPTIEVDTESVALSMTLAVGALVAVALCGLSGSDVVATTRMLSPSSDRWTA